MARLTRYRSERRMVQLISTLLFIILPFLNLLRLDIPKLKFYFFNTILWVDEFFLIFLVMMMTIWIILIFSMVYGRVWSGWMCPQMILNEVSIWLERRISRMTGKSHETPDKGGGFLTWTILTILYGLISLLFAFIIVAYFVDPYRMIADLWNGSFNPATGGIILAMTILLILDAVFIREKFCLKACPYAMLQLVVTDAKTQIVRYIKERDHDCIHCDACVNACLMGIDIRKSPYQTECTHCGDCIDACEMVLNRFNKPGLIEFSYGEQNIREKWYQKIGFVDAKRWIILGITVAFAVTLIAMIHFRQPIFLSASGDRSTLYRPTKSGDIINDYTIRISNRDLENGQFRIRCHSRTVSEDFRIIMDENPVPLASRKEQFLKLSIRTAGTHLNPGPNPLVLSAQNIDNPEVKAETDIVFFMPEADPLAGAGTEPGQ